MKTAVDAEPLDPAAVPWLLTCALATTVPHFEHLPWWLTTVASLALLLRFGAWLTLRRPSHRFPSIRLPPRWLLALVVVAATAGVFVEYKTLFGRDAGVALLVLFMALKPLEMTRTRDATVVIMLGFFLLLTHYFYSQSIPTGLWLLTAALLQTATLIRIHGGAQPPALVVRRAGILLLQAAPFMVVLFLLFPRIAGPLWGLPQDAHSSRSGLPDTIAPGSISDLILNGAIAFRVRFDAAVPANASLYWRGPVMDAFDGQRWQLSRLAERSSPMIEARSEPLTYEVTIEPHNQRWLLALDAAVGIPEGAAITSRLQVVSRTPVQLRSRFALRSSLDYRAGVDDSKPIRDTALQLPSTGNPRARELARGWRQRFGSAEAISSAALTLFRQEKFGYTLRPPLLAGDTIDQFLFETRSGFCEHYASAYVFLMRAAGVPARIVAGYQGGEFNPVDGYLVVRQSDAHAWAEIWIAGRGWVRQDPTAAIAPERVEQGIAAALPEGETLPAMARVDLDWLRQLRFRWEAVNNRWNQWVLGYNPERQREILTRLGFGDIDWRGMTALLSTLCGIALLGITAWTLWQRPRQDPAQRVWLGFCAHLAKRGAPLRAPWEGPRDYAQRVALAAPALGKITSRAADAYIDARYASGDAAIKGLRRLRTVARAL